MVWINEIVSAKFIAALKTSNLVTRAELLTNFEVLDSKIASGLKKVINEDFKRRVFIEEEAAHHNDILKFEVENDSVQWFNTRRDETIIAEKKQPGAELLEHVGVIVSFNSQNS